MSSPYLNFAPSSRRSAKASAPTSSSSTSLPSSSVQSARLEKFFARVKATLRGRVILAIDATASRQPTWDMAAQLQAEMFAVAADIGLEVQLVFYRGFNECLASRWVSDARSLVSIMGSVMCQSGHTQIEKVLRHAAKEHRQRPVNALVIVGDACEEAPETLYALAHDLKVKTFLFQEGDEPRVAGIYQKIAEITGGATAAFNAGAAQRLADLLRAVGAFAVGGLEALGKQRSEAAILLLGQLKGTDEKH